jgi:hypothetical protein
MREALVRILDHYCADFVRQIDPDSGLLRELLSSDVLSREQMDRCKAKETPADRIEEVIRFLRFRPDDCYEKFCIIVKKFREDFNPPNPEE